MAFPPLGSFDHVAVLDFVDFQTNLKQDALLHCIAYFVLYRIAILVLIGMVFVIIWEIWEDIFKLRASAAVSEFCEWIQIGIDDYILHCKYQIKSHSSPWFSAACAAAIVHGNHFFRLYRQNKYQHNVKLWQTIHCCKRVPEVGKLACATKTKESITSQKLGCRDFWQIANNVLNKGKFETA